MQDRPIPEADPADAQEQAEEVGPATTSAEVGPGGHGTVPPAHHLPLDAAEADVLEQELEVPLDEEER